MCQTINVNRIFILQDIYVVMQFYFHNYVENYFIFLITKCWQSKAFSTNKGIS